MRPRLVLACLLFTAAAQADSLESPACGDALQALESARGAAAGGTEALRQQAARICLGSTEPAAARSKRWAQPPMTVPPPVIAPPGPPAAAMVPQLPPPAVRIERPGTITSCDAHGCWASDGARLQRVGPQLTGPNGVCAVQGAVALCH